MSTPDPPFSPFARPPADALAFRVLWCDGDAERAARAQRVLAERAAVEIATDETAAVAAARRTPPDILVCALGSGLPALIDAMRADRRLAAVPVIAVGSSAAEAEAAARLPVADVLVAPFADHGLLARVATQLEIVRLSRALAEKQSESETWLGLALKAAGLGVWDGALGAGKINMDANLAAMFGLPRAPATLKDADWLARIHPEDRPRVLAELAARRRDQKPMEIDFRTVMPDGSHRALAVLGAVVRHVGTTPEAGVAYRSVGVARDVTERARDAAQQELLLGELNHRVRNTLAAVLALAQQTAQDAPSVAAFLAAFRARVMALASAHNLLTRGRWRSASLGALVEATLAPERGAGAAQAHPARVKVGGPACELPPQKALAMTMGLHELATNARKYGALSVAGGRLSVTWTIAEADGARRVTLVWLERGGPEVAPPTRSGFGSRLLRRALGVDLEGSVLLDFDPPGLRCTIEFPLDRTAANA